MTWYLVLIASLLTILGHLPLAFSFGRNFEYEYATALSWIVLVILPLLSLVLPNSLVESLFERGLPTPPGRRRYPQFFGVLSLFLVLGPACLSLAAIGSFSSGRCVCSANGFLFWFVLQVLPAYFFASALHWRVLKLRFENRYSRSFIFVVLVFLLLGAVILTASFLWFFPQKRIVSLLFGFLHGPIYDSWIPVDYGVILGRAAVLFMALFVVWIDRKCWQKSIGFRVRIVSAALLGAVLLGISMTSPTGTHGASFLKSKLSRAKSQGFVTLHYAPGDERYERRIAVLLMEAKFHSDEIASALYVRAPRPVHIYVYPSHEEKKLYFGGGATDVTDVWTPTVHITADQAPHQSLRHELVHAIASQFGWKGIGFHPNMALTEGLAVALAPSGSRHGLHELSAGLLHDGRVKNIESLFTPGGFWSEAGQRSYTIAGSFLTYLLHYAGPAAVRSLYSGEDFKAATGRTVKQWILDWQKHLAGLYDPKLALESEVLYRTPGVLNDLCPHTKSDFARSRSESILVRLRQPAGWDPSNYLNWRSTFDPQDLNSRVELWTQKIKEIASRRVAEPLALATWLETVKRARHAPAKTVEDIELALIESDILVVLGRRSESKIVLDELQGASHERPPGESLERQIAARILIETSGIEASRAGEWRRYLASWRPLPEVEDTDPWITHYLKLKRDVQFSRDSTMAHALQPLESMDPQFHKESLRVLAERFLALADYHNAELHYLRLAVLNTGERRAYYEMLARLANKSLNSFQ